MEIQTILSEVKYKAVRSSGAGGQNVNKVSSKVVLTFDLLNSQGFSEEEKRLLEVNLYNRLTSDLVLILNCDEDRSQIKNKDIVTKRFLDIIKKGLYVPKERKPTKITKAAIRKRIKDKKNVSEVKKNRKKHEF
ncbi:alternative ribosome rescue aminoacyl-tRNA hydrolase ArfB [Flavobacterium granuli]|uniref:Ribosome-associated protein n=1 Tax=Flavobacterium granuli TaxID=280093 RepID=A0ABU1S359_9FLAO|nr:alternative ribosome rescue aminoacyl-tRNA hydrolase ArfB [Flavobacterium granuli]MDR6845468.1 ribosome-associated protein [Flavobacterium granuli]